MGAFYSPHIKFMDITRRIIGKFTAKIISANLRISQSAVYAWVDESNTDHTTNIFSRVYAILDDLDRQGPAGRELALEVCRGFCDVLGCIPVMQPDRKISVNSLLRSIASDAKESAEVQVAFAGIVGDLQASEEILKKAYKEVVEEIESAEHLRCQLEFLIDQAKENGGHVILDADRVNKKTLTT